MLIEKSELPPGMPLKSTKRRVEPTQELNKRNELERDITTLPRCYTDPAILSQNV